MFSIWVHDLEFILFMLSKQEIEHIAKLARLGLSAEELARYQKDLSLILDYIGQLEKADIEGVLPTRHSVAVENAVRDGSLIEGFEKAKELVEAAPLSEEGYIKVKAIL